MNPDIVALIYVGLVIGIGIWAWKHAGSEGDKFNNSGDL